MIIAKDSIHIRNMYIICRDLKKKKNRKVDRNS